MTYDPNRFAAVLARHGLKAPAQARSAAKPATASTSADSAAYATGFAAAQSRVLAIWNTREAKANPGLALRMLSEPGLSHLTATRLANAFKAMCADGKHRNMFGDSDGEARALAQTEAAFSEHLKDSAKRKAAERGSQGGAWADAYSHLPGQH